MAKVIGIVGGIGSYAGIDLIKKIYDNTEVTKDQDHLPVAMLSFPDKVLDRTEFLLGKVNENPGLAIAEIITKLSDTGAEVIGIPCNTAHSPKILDVVLKNIPSSVKLLHIVEVTGRFFKKNYPEIKKVGILSTNGTYTTQIYPKVLAKFGVNAFHPSKEFQEKLVHPAIYNTKYGVKAFSNPVKKKAIKKLMKAAKYLINQGAEAIILACTEIPLAIRKKTIEDVMVIDATEVLAKALIRESIKR